jgi:putative ABC transport system permease protein
MTSSMEDLEDLSQGILFGANLTTAIVLVLLLMLFLRERKAEIMIYIALGENKIRILLQILFEILIVSVVGINLALIFSTSVAERISTQMLKTDLIQRSEIPINHISIDSRSLYGMGFRFEMSIEEMLQHYQVNLDISVIFAIFGTILLIILLSTLAASLYMMHLKPKEVLS